MSTTTLTLELRHETANAYLVSDDGKTEHWLPKSFCEHIRDLPRKPGATSITSEFEVAEWLAKREGLI